MGNVGEVRPEPHDAGGAEQPVVGRAEKDPPYQALFPNLDHLSRSSFGKGTVSRRRIARALGLLALVPVVVLAAILLPQLLG